MFYGGLVGVFLTLPLVVYLFIRLQIIEVFEDITGLRIRKKTREQMELYHLQTSGNLRQTSESIRIRKQYTTGHHTHSERSASLKPIAVGQTNLQSVTPIDQSALSSELQYVNTSKQPDETTLLNELDETELLQENGANKTTKLGQEEHDETELLRNDNYSETVLLQNDDFDETTLLKSEDHDETALLQSYSDETTFLEDELQETTLLNGTTDETVLLTDDETVLLDETEDDFILQKNIIIVHSNHIIGKER